MSNEHRFVALYAGDSICGAKMIFASADPRLVQQVSERIAEEVVLYPTKSRRALRRIATQPTNKKTAEAAQ